ncbi:ATP-binding protein [Pannonibacter tanglangensis]|uniref:histidine kinase n=1 Tax=Pannonibacter tanglangensis TaxID=2750084 RepID=A0ABW9ZF95_9HYPH|nr:HAMP domain-containing protein [Pannonibacter sp. XCT-34]
MTRLIAYFWPERIAAQLMLVMISALILITTFVFAFFALLRPTAPHSDAISQMLLLGRTVHLLNEAAPAERPGLIRDINAATRRYELHLVDPSEPLLGVPPALQDRITPPRDLDAGMRFLGSMPMGPERGVVVEFSLADGTRLRAEHLAKRGGPPLIGSPFLQILFFLALSLAMLLVWALRTLVRPLSDLERAVSVFGEGQAEPVIVTERGPREVRAAASAFNRMQVRIRDLIDRRTRMLAAIGHDLRTPLTRLRLRLELMDDGDQKDRNLADLAVMEAQINGALTFLREGRTGERTGPVDLPSLLLSVQDQYEDMGQTVTLTCAPGLTVHGRASEMVRAVSNLIDNAHRHAGIPDVRAFAREDQILIEVADHGPGLSSAEKLRLIEPFERGDAARTVADGQGMGQATGFGLGLATARAIAEGHGGRLELDDTQGGGLTARILLPRAG